MKLTSHHGTTLDVVPGRTCLHYIDGFLQDDIQTWPSQYDAKHCAEQKNAAALTRPLPYLHRYRVAQ